MIKVFYCFTGELEDMMMPELLGQVPAFMWDDIMRYREIRDRKARLLARLMLKDGIIRSTHDTSLDNWQLDSNKRPFIEHWDNFNISHSGELVLFCHSQEAVGIDTEQVLSIDYRELSQYFSLKEIDLISRSSDHEKLFYEIWVKKESFLKTIGTGLLTDLKKVCCVNESLVFKGNTYYFYKLSIDHKYTTYLCSIEKNALIQTNKFRV